MGFNSAFKGLIVCRMSAPPGGLAFEVNSSAFWHYIVEFI